MTTINITPEFQATLSATMEAGKTPWVIINEDYAVGAYAGRTAAREAKAAENLTGKILKADEVEFKVVDLATAAQALIDEEVVVTSPGFRNPGDVFGSAMTAAKYSTPDATLVASNKSNSIDEEAPTSVAPVGEEMVGDPHAYLCPHCGVCLDNGIGQHLQEVNDYLVKHEKYEYACLSCGGEFGPAIAVATKKLTQPKPVGAVKPMLHESSIERPCKRVWAIADEMFAANPQMKRKDVLARCVAEGIAFYTARTQYQQWLGIQREMATATRATLK